MVLVFENRLLFFIRVFGRKDIVWEYGFVDVDLFSDSNCYRDVYVLG